MTNEPREPENGQTFEEDLKAVQAEWSRMEQPEPPELVDQAVLNTARRDLQPRRKARPLRWLGGFATATVIVLAVTITLEQQNPQSPDPASADIGQLQRDAATSPGMEESAVMKVEQAPLPAAEPQAQTREARRQKQAIKAAPSTGEVKTRKMEITAPAIDASKFNMTPGTAISEEAETAEPAEAVAEAKEDAEESKPPKTAEDWIQQLRLLRDYGHMKKLAGELAAFRHYYPEYPLPEELAELEP